MNDSVKNYSDHVSSDHRNNFGQFFTDLRIAKFMTKWAIGTRAKDIYDPAFGLGAFYQSAYSLNPEINFYGSEIDPQVLNHAFRQFPQLKRKNIVLQDYLLSWNFQHDAIICNPPYMRFQKFKNRDAVYDAFNKNLGMKLSGYTNSASAFLLKSLSELNTNGRLAYIMPFEFLNTGYGILVKENLLKNGMLRHLIQINCEKEAFPDAITSIGIILVEKNTENQSVEFRSVNSIKQLEETLKLPPLNRVLHKDLNPNEKWLKYFDEDRITVNSSILVQLSEYGTFNRGIATGANEFFTLSRTKARSNHIPDSALLHCITKSPQIRSSYFSQTDLDKLEMADSPVFLLNVNKSNFADVEDYIRQGEEKGFHQRYLTKTKIPWYKIERRSPAPLLFGVFSRDKFKVIRNLTDARYLTCYHGFYPNLFGEGLVDSLFLYFHSRTARKILGLSMRKYGDGLEKFEPNDLNSSLVPSIDWFSSLNASQIEEGLLHIKEHGQLPDNLETKFEDLLTSSLPYSQSEEYIARQLERGGE